MEKMNLKKYQEMKEFKKECDNNFINFENYVELKEFFKNADFKNDKYFEAIRKIKKNIYPKLEKLIYSKREETTTELKFENETVYFYRFNPKYAISDSIEFMGLDIKACNKRKLLNKASESIAIKMYENIQ